MLVLFWNIQEIRWNSTTIQAETKLLKHRQWNMLCDICAGIFTVENCACADIAAAKLPISVWK